MTPLEALLLGVVEGLTELLPVSSTGHLILVGDALGHQGDAAKAFDVVIQLGAVIAIAVYFRAKLGALLGGVLRREQQSLRLATALLAAFVPTAIAGLFLHRQVKEHLFGSVPVAGALIVGGFIMVALHRRCQREGALEGIEHVTLRMAVVIGLCQCLALWPGASRSMTTIVAGVLVGLSLKSSAEFSFLLALPTLGAATIYDLFTSGSAIFATEGGALALGIGLVTAFFVTWAAITWFLRYVARVGLAPFGIYRILLGAVVLLIV